MRRAVASSCHRQEKQVRLSLSSVLSWFSIALVFRFFCRAEVVEMARFTPPVGGPAPFSAAAARRRSFKLRIRGSGDGLQTRAPCFYGSRSGGEASP